jgi:hypothetical protein
MIQSTFTLECAINTVQENQELSRECQLVVCAKCDNLFGLLSFWTLSIVQYFLKHDVSETGSVMSSGVGQGASTLSRVDAPCPTSED